MNEWMSETSDLVYSTQIFFFLLFFGLSMEMVTVEAMMVNTIERHIPYIGIKYFNNIIFFSRPEIKETLFLSLFHCCIDALLLTCYIPLRYLI